MEEAKGVSTITISKVSPKSLDLELVRNPTQNVPRLENLWFYLCLCILAYQLCPKGSSSSERFVSSGRWPPKWLQDGPKWPQDGLKTAATWAYDRFKMAPRSPQDGSTSAPRWLRMTRNKLSLRPLALNGQLHKLRKHTQNNNTNFPPKFRFQPQT